MDPSWDLLRGLSALQALVILSCEAEDIKSDFAPCRLDVGIAQDPSGAKGWHQARPVVASEWYCWRTKSCTTKVTKDDDYPIVYRVLTIPAIAGFLPSTVGGTLWGTLGICWDLLSWSKILTHWSWKWLGHGLLERATESLANDLFKTCLTISYLIRFPRS